MANESFVWHVGLKLDGIEDINNAIARCEQLEASINESSQKLTNSVKDVSEFERTRLEESKSSVESIHRRLQEIKDSKDSDGNFYIGRKKSNEFSESELMDVLGITRHNKTEELKQREDFNTKAFENDLAKIPAELRSSLSSVLGSMKGIIENEYKRYRFDSNSILEKNRARTTDEIANEIIGDRNFKNAYANLGGPELDKNVLKSAVMNYIRQNMSAIKPNELMKEIVPEYSKNMYSNPYKNKTIKDAAQSEYIKSFVDVQGKVQDKNAALNIKNTFDSMLKGYDSLRKSLLDISDLKEITKIIGSVPGVLDIARSLGHVVEAYNATDAKAKGIDVGQIKLKEGYTKNDAAELAAALLEKFQSVSIDKGIGYGKSRHENPFKNDSEAARERGYEAAMRSGYFEASDRINKMIESKAKVTLPDIKVSENEKIWQSIMNAWGVKPDKTIGSPVASKPRIDFSKIKFETTNEPFKPGNYIISTNEKPFVPNIKTTTNQREQYVVEKVNPFYKTNYRADPEARKKDIVERINLSFDQRGKSSTGAGQLSSTEIRVDESQLTRMMNADDVRTIYESLVKVKGKPRMPKEVLNPGAKIREEDTDKWMQELTSIGNAPWELDYSDYEIAYMQKQKQYEDYLRAKERYDKRLAAYNAKLAGQPTREFSGLLEAGERTDLMKVIGFEGYDFEDKKQKEQMNSIIKEYFTAGNSSGYIATGIHGTGSHTELNLMDENLYKAINQAAYARAVKAYGELGISEADIPDAAKKSFQHYATGGFDLKDIWTRLEKLKQEKLNTPPANEKDRQEFLEQKLALEKEFDKAVDAANKIRTPSVKQGNLDFETLKKGRFLFVDYENMAENQGDRNLSSITKDALGLNYEIKPSDGLSILSTVFGKEGLHAQARLGASGKGSVQIMEDPLAFQRKIFGENGTIKILSGKGEYSDYSLSNKENIFGVINVGDIKDSATFKGIWAEKGIDAAEQWFRVQNTFENGGLNIVSDYINDDEAIKIGSQAARQYFPNIKEGMYQAEIRNAIIKGLHDPSMAADVAWKYLYNEGNTKYKNFELVRPEAKGRDAAAMSDPGIQADIRNFERSSLFDIVGNAGRVFDTVGDYNRKGFEYANINTNPIFASYETFNWAGKDKLEALAKARTDGLESLDKAFDLSEIKNFIAAQDNIFNKLEEVFGVDQLKALHLIDSNGNRLDKNLASLLSLEGYYDENGNKLSNVFYSKEASIAGSLYRNPGQLGETFSGINIYDLLSPLFKDLGYDDSGYAVGLSARNILAGADFDGDRLKNFMVRGLDPKKFFTDLGIGDSKKDIAKRFDVASMFTRLNKEGTNLAITDEYGDRIKELIKKYESSGSNISYLEALKQIDEGRTEQFSILKKDKDLATLLKGYVSPRAEEIKNGKKQEETGATSFEEMVSSIIDRSMKAPMGMGATSNVPARLASPLLGAFFEDNINKYREFAIESLIGNDSYNVFTTLNKKNASLSQAQMQGVYDYSKIGFSLDRLQRAWTASIYDEASQTLAEENNLGKGTYYIPQNKPNDDREFISSKNPNLVILGGKLGDKTAINIEELSKTSDIKGMPGNNHTAYGILNALGYGYSDMQAAFGGMVAKDVSSAETQKTYEDMKKAFQRAVNMDSLFGYSYASGKDENGNAVYKNAEGYFGKNSAVRDMMLFNADIIAGQASGNRFFLSPEEVAYSTELLAAAQEEIMNVANNRFGKNGTYGWINKTTGVVGNSSFKQHSIDKRNREIAQAISEGREAPVAYTEDDFERISRETFIGNLKKATGWNTAAARVGVLSSGKEGSPKSDIGGVGATSAEITQWIAQAVEKNYITKDEGTNLLERIKESNAIKAQIGETPIKTEAAKNILDELRNKQSLTLRGYNIDSLSLYRENRLGSKQYIDNLYTSLGDAFNQISKLNPVHSEDDVKSIYRRLGLNDEIIELLTVGTGDDKRLIENIGDLSKNHEVLSALNFKATAMGFQTRSNERNGITSEGVDLTSAIRQIATDNDEYMSVKERQHKIQREITAKEEEVSAAIAARAEAEKKLSEISESDIAARKEASDAVTKAKQVEEDAVKSLNEKKEELEAPSKRMQEVSSRFNDASLIGRLLGFKEQEDLKNELFGLYNHYKSVVDPYKGTELGGIEVGLNPELGFIENMFNKKEKIIKSAKDAGMYPGLVDQIGNMFPTALTAEFKNKVSSITGENFKPTLAFQNGKKLEEQLMSLEDLYYQPEKYSRLSTKDFINNNRTALENSKQLGQIPSELLNKLTSKETSDADFTKAYDDFIKYIKESLDVFNKERKEKGLDEVSLKDYLTNELKNNNGEILSLKGLDSFLNQDAIISDMRSAFNGKTLEELKAKVTADNQKNYTNELIKLGAKELGTPTAAITASNATLKTDIDSLYNNITDGLKQYIQELNEQITIANKNGLSKEQISGLESMREQAQKKLDATTEKSVANDVARKAAEQQLGVLEGGVAELEKLKAAFKDNDTAGIEKYIEKLKELKETLALLRNSSTMNVISENRTMNKRLSDIDNALYIDGNVENIKNTLAKRADIDEDLRKIVLSGKGSVSSNFVMPDFETTLREVRQNQKEELDYNLSHMPDNRSTVISGEYRLREEEKINAESMMLAAKNNIALIQSGTSGEAKTKALEQLQTDIENYVIKLIEEYDRLIKITPTSDKRKADLNRKIKSIDGEIAKGNEAKEYVEREKRIAETDDKIKKNDSLYSLLNKMNKLTGDSISGANIDIPSMSTVIAEKIKLNLQKTVDEAQKQIDALKDNPANANVVADLQKKIDELQKRIGEISVDSVQKTLEQITAGNTFSTAFKSYMNDFNHSSMLTRASDMTSMRLGINTPSMAGRMLISNYITGIQGDITTATTERDNMLKSILDRGEKEPATAAENARIAELNQRIQQGTASMTSLTQAYDGFGATAVGIFAKVSQSFNRYITKMIRQMWQEAKKFVKEFEASMTTIQMITNKSDEAMNSVRNNAIAKAKELKVSISDITKIQTALYRQGLSDEEVNKRTDVVAKYSVVTGQDITSSLKSLTTAVNSGLVDNLQKAADVLVALGDAAATTAQEIAKGLQKSAVAASNAGMSYEELTALLTVGTSKTQLGGSQIGRSVTSILSRMTRVTNDKLDTSNDTTVSLNDVEEALSNVGVRLRDEKDSQSFRNVTDVLLDLAGVWEELTDLQKSNVSYTIAGTTQSNVFQTLLEAMSEDDTYKELLGKAENSEGTLDSKYDIAMESLNASITSLKTAFDSIVENMSPIIGAFQGLIDIITFITNGLAELDIVGSIAYFIGVISSVVGIYILTQRLLTNMLGLKASAVALTGSAKALTAAAAALATSGTTNGATNVVSSITSTAGATGLFGSIGLSSISSFIIAAIPYIIAAVAALGLTAAVVSKVVKENSSEYKNNKLLNDSKEYGNSLEQLTNTTVSSINTLIEKSIINTKGETLLKDALTTDGFDELKSIIDVLEFTLPGFTKGLDLTTITLEEFREKLTKTADDVSLAQRKKLLDSASNVDYSSYIKKYKESNVKSVGIDKLIGSDIDDSIKTILLMYQNGELTDPSSIILAKRYLQKTYDNAKSSSSYNSIKSNYGSFEAFESAFLNKQITPGIAYEYAVGSTTSKNGRTQIFEELSDGLNFNESESSNAKITFAKNIYTQMSDFLSELGFTDEQQSLLGKSFYYSISNIIDSLSEQEITDLWNSWYKENIKMPLYNPETTIDDVLSNYSAHKYAVVGDTSGAFYYTKEDALKNNEGLTERDIIDISTGKIVGASAQSYLDTTQYNLTDSINKANFAMYVSSFESIEDFFADMNSSTDNIDKYAAYLSDENLSKVALQVANGEKSFKDFIDAVVSYAETVSEEIVYSTDRLNKAEEYSEYATLELAVINGTATDSEIQQYKVLKGLPSTFSNDAVKAWANHNNNDTTSALNYDASTFGTRLATYVVNGILNKKEGTTYDDVINAIAPALNMDGTIDLSTLMAIGSTYGLDMSTYEELYTALGSNYSFSAKGLSTNANVSLTGDHVEKDGTTWIAAKHSEYGDVLVNQKTGEIQITKPYTTEGYLDFTGTDSSGKAYRFTTNEYKDNEITKGIDINNKEYTIEKDNDGYYALVGEEKVRLSALTEEQVVGNYYTGGYTVDGEFVPYTPKQIISNAALKDNTMASRKNTSYMLNTFKGLRSNNSYSPAIWTSTVEEPENLAILYSSDEMATLQNIYESGDMDAYNAYLDELIKQKEEEIAKILAIGVTDSTVVSYITSSTSEGRMSAVNSMISRGQNDYLASQLLTKIENGTATQSDYSEFANITGANLEEIKKNPSNARNYYSAYNTGTTTQKSEFNDYADKQMKSLLEKQVEAESISIDVSSFETTADMVDWILDETNGCNDATKELARSWKAVNDETNKSTQAAKTYGDALDKATDTRKTKEATKEMLTYIRSAGFSMEELNEKLNSDNTWASIIAGSEEATVIMEKYKAGIALTGDEAERLAAIISGLGKAFNYEELNATAETLISGTNSTAYSTWEQKQGKFTDDYWALSPQMQTELNSLYGNEIDAVLNARTETEYTAAINGLYSAVDYNRIYQGISNDTPEYFKNLYSGYQQYDLDIKNDNQIGAEDYVRSVAKQKAQYEYYKKIIQGARFGTGNYTAEQIKEAEDFFGGYSYDSREILKQVNIYNGAWNTFMSEVGNGLTGLSSMIEEETDALENEVWNNSLGDKKYNDKEQSDIDAFYAWIKQNPNADWTTYSNWDDVKGYDIVANTYNSSVSKGSKNWTIAQETTGFKNWGSTGNVPDDVLTPILEKLAVGDFEGARELINNNPNYSAEQIRAQIQTNYGSEVNDLLNYDTTTTNAPYYADIVSRGKNNYSKKNLEEQYMYGKITEAEYEAGSWYLGLNEKASEDVKKAIEDKAQNTLTPFMEIKDDYSKINSYLTKIADGTITDLDWQDILDTYVGSGALDTEENRNLAKAEMTKRKSGYTTQQDVLAATWGVLSESEKKQFLEASGVNIEEGADLNTLFTDLTGIDSTSYTTAYSKAVYKNPYELNNGYYQRTFANVLSQATDYESAKALIDTIPGLEQWIATNSTATEVMSNLKYSLIETSEAADTFADSINKGKEAIESFKSTSRSLNSTIQNMDYIISNAGSWTDSQKETVATSLGYSSWADYVKRGGTESTALTDYTAQRDLKVKEQLDNINSAIGNNFFINGSVANGLNDSDYDYQTGEMTAAAGSDKDYFMSLGFDEATAEELAYEARYNDITFKTTNAYNKSTGELAGTRYYANGISSTYNYNPGSYYTSDIEKLNSLYLSGNASSKSEIASIYSSWYQEGAKYNNANSLMTKLQNGTITEKERQSLASYLGIDASQLRGDNAYSFASDIFANKTAERDQRTSELKTALTSLSDTDARLKSLLDTEEDIYNVAEKIKDNAGDYNDETVAAAENLLADKAAIEATIGPAQEMDAAISSALDTRKIEAAKLEMADYLDTHTLEEFNAELENNESWQTAIANSGALADAFARIEEKGLTGAAAINEITKALYGLNAQFTTAEVQTEVDKYKDLEWKDVQKNANELLADNPDLYNQMIEEAPWIKEMVEAGDDPVKQRAAIAHREGYYAVKDYKNNAGTQYDSAFGENLYNLKAAQYIIDDANATDEEKGAAAQSLLAAQTAIGYDYGDYLYAKELIDKINAGDSLNNREQSWLSNYTGYDYASSETKTFVENKGKIWDDRIKQGYIKEGEDSYTASQTRLGYNRDFYKIEMDRELENAANEQKKIDDYNFTTLEQFKKDFAGTSIYNTLMSDKTLSTDAQYATAFNKNKTAASIFGTYGGSNDTEAESLYLALASGNIDLAKDILAKSPDRADLEARYSKIYGGDSLKYTAEGFDITGSDADQFNIDMNQAAKNAALYDISLKETTGVYSSKEAGWRRELVDNYNFNSESYGDYFKDKALSFNNNYTKLAEYNNQLETLNAGGEAAYKVASDILGAELTKYSTREAAITEAIARTNRNKSSATQGIDDTAAYWNILTDKQKQLYLSEINASQGTNWSIEDFESAIAYDPSKYASSSQSFLASNPYEFATPMYQTSFYDKLQAGVNEGMSESAFIQSLTPEMISWLESGNAGSAGELYRKLADGQISLTKATREYSKEIGKDAKTQNDYTKSLAKTKEELRNIKYYLDKGTFDKSDGSDDLKDLASILGLSEETIKKMEDGEIVRMLESQYKAYEQQLIEGLESISSTFSTFDASKFKTGTDENGNIKVNVGGIELVAGEGVKTVGIDEAIAMAKALGEDTLVRELEAIAEEEGKVSLDVWETMEDGKPTVHAAWKGVELSGIKGARSSSGGGGGKSAADKLIDKWKNRIEVNQHRINMLDKEAEGYKNKGELTNYGSVLSYKRDELLALKSEYEQANEELKKLYATTSKGTKNSDSDDALKLRNQIKTIV